MSIALEINGTTYNYPETDDVEWGAEATDWAAAVTSGMLQKAGGLFQLLAEVDFGTGYGIKSLYLKSRAASPASAGQVRLGNAETVAWRNNADDGDLGLVVNSSDRLQFDSVNLISASSTDTLTNKTISASNNTLSDIANASIAANAAIAFSKLASLTSGNILVGNGSNVAASVAMSGDVTINNSGVTAIGSNKVTNAMLAQVATARFKGRTTSGTGNVEDLTGTQATALLDNFVGDSGSGGTKGLVPAPAAGDAAAEKFLKADGTWTAPPGAGDVVGPASSTDNGFARFDGLTGKLLKDSAATIVNADVSASAAIDRSKLANGSANHVVINSGTGAFSSEATLAKSRGGTGADNSSVTFPASGTIPTLGANQTFSGVQTFSARMLVSSGTVGEPSVGFSADDDTSGTGIYRVAADSLGFAANGVNIGQYSAAGAWTLGATGGAETHNIRGAICNLITATGDGSIRLRTTGDNTSKSIVYFGDSNAATVGSVQYDHADDSLNFYTNSTNRAQIISGRLLFTAADVESQILARSSASAASSTKRIIDAQYTVDTNCTGGYFFSCINSDGTIIGKAEATSNTAIAWQTSSDARLKEDPKDFEGLALVMAMKPYDFRWKSSDGKRGKGFFAQELHQVLPEVVSVGSDRKIPRRVPDESNPGQLKRSPIAGDEVLENPWGVDYAGLTPVLVKAIQELKAQIEVLNAELAELKAALAEKESKI